MKALLLLLVTACGAQRVPEPLVELRIVTEPPATRVYLNERFVGTSRTLARYPLYLKPGVWRLTVEAPGFFPHDTEVRVRGGTSVKVRLRAIPQ